jgi:hypothetical protein
MSAAAHKELTQEIFEACLVYRLVNGKFVEMREDGDAVLCGERLGLFPR